MVFVKGMPPETTAEQVRATFEKFGRIMDIKLLKRSRTARRRKENHPRRKVQQVGCS